METRIYKYVSPRLLIFPIYEHWHTCLFRGLSGDLSVFTLLSYCLFWKLNIAKVRKLTSMCDLVVHTWYLRMVHRLSVVKISARSFQNPWRNDKIVAQTLKKTHFWHLTSRCDLDHGSDDLVLTLKHRVNVVYSFTVLQNIFKIHQGLPHLWSRHTCDIQTDRAK